MPAPVLCIVSAGPFLGVRFADVVEPAVLWANELSQIAWSNPTRGSAARAGSAGTVLRDWDVQTSVSQQKRETTASSLFKKHVVEAIQEAAPSYYMDVHWKA